MRDARWKPDSRENHTLTSLNGMLYLYGGIGREIFSEMNTLNTENWQWAQIGQEGDMPLEGRQGHSMNALKNCLILFGGERKYNKSMKIRECFGDCRVYNTSTKQWSLIRQYGEYLESRRNHLSCVVGKFLIVIGGVDSNGKYLNDVSSINLESFKATLLEQEDGYDQGIAFSACCAVFKNDSKIENLYTNLEKMQSKQIGIQTGSQQGIYVFGGRKDNGDAMDRLRLLQIGKKPLKWIDLEFSGKAPQARFCHTLTYYKDSNSLVLIGGRNEMYLSKEGSNIFQDIHIFSLDFSEWIKVDIKGSGIPSRYSHSATILDSKIIVFGGISNNGICSSDLTIIELDQRKANAFLKEHNHRLQYQTDRDLVKSSHLIHQFSIEGIISKDNYLFQIPSHIRQKKHYHHNFLNNLGSSNNNYHRHHGKKQTFNENSKEQDVEVDADTLKSMQQPISSFLQQNQIPQIHHEFDRTLNNRYQGVKTFLPLPLLPKRNTLRFVSAADFSKDHQNGINNTFGKKSQQDSLQDQQKRTSILKGEKRTSIELKSKMCIKKEESSASSSQSNSFDYKD